MRTTPYLLLFIVCLSCYNLKERGSANIQGPASAFAMDTALLSDTTLRMKASVKETYRRNEYRLLWFDSGRLSHAGDSLLDFIRRAAYYGLIPGDYRQNEIRLLLKDTTNTGSLMRSDLFLTDGFFLLWQHLKNGRLKKDTFIPVNYSDTIDVEGIETLASGISSVRVRQYLESAQPQSEQYFSFKDNLVKFLKDPPEDSVMIRRKISLIVNMERLRRKEELPSRRLEVNIPSFTMKVMEGDTIVLESKVIVGKPETPTPLINSVINYFTIYPYWHVPRSIATKELLPLIQSDSLYLRKHNYDVLDRSGNVAEASAINWKALTADNFPYTLRQREGNENSLGVLKFNFSNRYGVYLHDTNVRGLFRKSFRALSHGCVRVQKAAELARYLVKEDSIYITPDDLDQYLEVRQRLKINVPQSLPLYLQYHTAEWKEGSLIFYDDIYKIDEIIYRKLSGYDEAGAAPVL